MILPLFIFTLTADIFAGELADRTMKITLLRPVSRWKVYAGKNAAIALFSGLTLLVSFVFAMVGGLFLLGGAGLIRGVPQAALAYLVTWLPMLALGIIAAFFSQFFKQSSGALLANIFIYLLGKGLPFVSSAVGRLTPYFYTSWYVGWLGQTAGFGRLLQVLIILIAYSIMFLGAGFYFFDRRGTVSRGKSMSIKLRLILSYFAMLVVPVILSIVAFMMIARFCDPSKRLGRQFYAQLEFGAAGGRTGPNHLCRGENHRRQRSAKTGRSG